RDSVNHLQATLSLVSLWRSEGEERQGHRRAEGKGAADDNEKHDTYKSISNAANGQTLVIFSPGHDFCDRSNSLEICRLQCEYRSHWWDSGFDASFREIAQKIPRGGGHLTWLQR